MFVDDGSRLTARCEFADFTEAFAFLARVAAVADTMGHHPDMSISWNVVTISCVSHDVGAVTERDHRLAKAIEEIR